MIPDTPDVPATDPADDDPSHDDTPSRAAELVTLSRSRLRGHDKTLAAAVERLKDIRDRRA